MLWGMAPAQKADMLWLKTDDQTMISLRSFPILELLNWKEVGIAFMQTQDFAGIHLK